MDTIWGTVPQWISALSVALILWQVRVNFDNQRRQKAVDSLKLLNDITEKNTFRYILFLFSLSPEDIKAIYAGEPLKLEVRFIQPYLPELIKDGACIEHTSVQLTVDQVIEIRLAMVKMLNTLEQIAIAYKHGVADKKIIKEALYPYLIEKGFLRNCSAFRVHFGKLSWSALDDLEKLLSPPPHLRKPPA